MPGVFNLSVDQVVKEAREARGLGVSSVILFGLPEKKDEVATGAWTDDGVVQQAARAIKGEIPDLILIGDVCLCEYMSHGHCGIVRKPSAPKSLGAAATSAITVAVEPHEKMKAIEAAAAVAARATQPEFEIDNDATLDLLARTSVSLTRAGIDVIAPSDMMDGRVAAIRRALDGAGCINTPILSYAAKFASGFYGPCRISGLRRICHDRSRRPQGLDRARPRHDGISTRDPPRRCRYYRYLLRQRSR